MLFSISSSDLLPRIPLSAQSVLSIGCGTGDLLAAIRRMNPRIRLLAIESDADAAKGASAWLDEVAVTDVEANPLPFDVGAGLDCIVYDNVLQHMRDPWAVVRSHAQALSPHGVILICVPNADYWRLIDQRLRGQSESLNEPGMSLGGLTAKLQEAGLTVCDLTMRIPDGDAAAWFCSALAPGLVGVGIDTRDFAHRSSSTHLIVRATRHAVEPIVVSASMLPHVGGVSQVRVILPMQAMATEPGVTAVVTDRVDTSHPGDATPRIFILHRPALFGEGGLETVTRLPDAGYLTVTEFDDHPDHFQMMQVGGALGFIGVHALQTSTPALAEVLARFNPEIAIFPNTVVALPEVRNFADSGALTFFFGALNREADWQPLMPVINEVAALAGERLKFQVLHDQGFFEALATPHKTFTPVCEYDTYLEILRGSEISFMPLSDTPFNRSKSDLKFIEAAASRVTALASTIVYEHSIEDGRTGLLFRDPGEFRSRLLRLIALPRLARDLADAARGYVADKRMAAYQVAPRLNWYHGLWKRREELEAARRERVQRFLAMN